jgi:predicted transcriptional regulator of viral defense system
MKSREALHVLSEVTESQWGLVTSAQARSRDISPMTITRLCKSGDLVRIAHGVYRDAGSPNDEYEALRAAWLMTEPGKLAYERLSEHPIGFVVSGESATRLHNIGDLRAPHHEFTTPRRKQTQRADTRYRIATLPEQDITVKNGLPVTTRERTIADLVESRYDLSLIADALRDAYTQFNIDTSRLTELLSPLAKRNGHASGDGAALLEQLLAIAGINQSALAHEVASNPKLGSLVTERYLESLYESLGALSDSNSLPLQHAIAAVLDAMRGTLFEFAHTQTSQQIDDIAWMANVRQSVPKSDMKAIPQTLKTP